MGTFLNDWSDSLIPWLLAIGIPLILWITLNVTFLKVFRDKELPLSIWSHLKFPVGLIVFVVSLYSSAKLQISELHAYWDDFFRIILIISISWVLIAAVGIGRTIISGLYDINAEDNLKARKVYTQIRVFERILIVIILIISTALVLMTFESVRSLGTSLLASAGIAGVIIGVAAQRLLANLLAGFQIAITQPIRLEDVVIMENEWGWIEEITLTYVVVRIWDKRRLIVPSAQVIEKPFQNWTRKKSDILGTVFLYADYKLPVDAIRKELTNILNNTPLWDEKVNVLQVTNLTDRAMELRALVSAKNSPTAWDLRVLVREKLVTFLQKEYPECLPKTRVTLDKTSEE